jgi:hypothetical protein
MFDDPAARSLASAFAARSVQGIRLVRPFLSTLRQYKSARKLKCFYVIQCFSSGLRRNPYCFSRGRTRQSVIPHGHHCNGFEKYLIVAVSLVTLVFAV